MNEKVEYYSKRQFQDQLYTFIIKISLVVRESCSYFEAFLKVVVLFKEHGVINDDLWRGNAQVNDAVIHSFCRLRAKKEKDYKTYISNSFQIKSQV